jgi:hypothetical protein
VSLPMQKMMVKKLKKMMQLVGNRIDSVIH